MPQGVPTVDDDLIDAIREDDIESIIAEAREHQEARDGTSDYD
jgi:hypothetical protein